MGTDELAPPSFAAVRAIQRAVVAEQIASRAVCHIASWSSDQRERLKDTLAIGRMRTHRLSELRAAAQAWASVEASPALQDSRLRVQRQRLEDERSCAAGVPAGQVGEHSQLGVVALKVDVRDVDRWALFSETIETHQHSHLLAERASADLRLSCKEAWQAERQHKPSGVAVGANDWAGATLAVVVADRRREAQMQKVLKWAERGHSREKQGR
mmetsp:Transcript_93532/g.263819  ORF Transcript_93532/g.263819 Transcript_93532/m.263819 type:complete len:213 (-) Transcript_93532:15-653(-)